MEIRDLKIDLKHWFNTVLKFSLKRVAMSDKFENAKQEIREKYQGRIKEKDLRKYVYLSSYGKELEEWEIEQMKFNLHFVFMPDEDELFLINLKRENKFDELKEDYLFKLGLCVLGENVLIDKVIKQKQYIYLKYYYNDNLISLTNGFARNLSTNERCNTIIENLSSDLALFDFVQYLKGRKKNDMNDDEKDVIVQNHKKVKSLRTIQTEEKYREYVKLYCTSLKKYSDKKKAKKEVLKEYDIDERTLRRALTNECNKEILDTLKIKV